MEDDEDIAASEDEHKRRKRPLKTRLTMTTLDKRSDDCASFRNVTCKQQQRGNEGAGTRDYILVMRRVAETLTLAAGTKKHTPLSMNKKIS